MDFLALFIGILLGLIIGFGLAWFWATAHNASKTASAQNTEAELKGLLAQQAQNHLQNTRNTIQNLERELANLSQSVTHFEQSMSTPASDDKHSAFFGEQTSLFLRNTEHKPSKTITNKSSDAQPRDFANNGSGLFVGAPVSEEQQAQEKTNN